jgi:hypothetical protein
MVSLIAVDRSGIDGYQPFVSDPNHVPWPWLWTKGGGGDTPKGTALRGGAAGGSLHSTHAGATNLTEVSGPPNQLGLKQEDSTQQTNSNAAGEASSVPLSPYYHMGNSWPYYQDNPRWYAQDIAGGIPALAFPEFGKGYYPFLPMAVTGSPANPMPKDSPYMKNPWAFYGTPFGMTAKKAEEPEEEETDQEEPEEEETDQEEPPSGLSAKFVNPTTGEVAQVPQAKKGAARSSKKRRAKRGAKRDAVTQFVRSPTTAAAAISPAAAPAPATPVTLATDVHNATAAGAATAPADLVPTPKAPAPAPRHGQDAERAMEQQQQQQVQQQQHPTSGMSAPAVHLAAPTEAQQKLLAFTSNEAPPPANSTREQLATKLEQQAEPPRPSEGPK